MRPSRGEASEKYKEAIELYRTTELSITEISNRCGVSRSGLSAYILRCHRNLMLARHGIEEKDAGKGRPYSRQGQRPETHRKYKEAIEACDSEEFIELNVSQIARRFNLDGNLLASQLRCHYPDIIPRREAARRRMGIADNLKRGSRIYASEAYAPALELLRDTDITIEDAAAECGVSFSGLRQHLSYYHRDIIERRCAARRAGMEVPVMGRVGGNGVVRRPDEAQALRFAEGVNLFRTTSLTVKEIAERTGVTPQALGNHLRMWHRQLIFERRGAGGDAALLSDRAPISVTKRYSKAAAEKYAPAIERLRATGESVEETARRFGFRPDVFRHYLREHEPEIWKNMGMTKLADGRKVLRRSSERYARAIEIFATTTEPLKSICQRLGLTYNSCGGYIRRNRPDAIEAHNRLLGARQ